MRCEHRADRGHHDVVRPFLERQVLGVGLDPLELDPLGFRPRPAGVEQLGSQIACGHVRAALRSHDRRVAGPGRHVENAHALADAAGLDEPWTERQQERLDHRRVVA